MLFLDSAKSAIAKAFYDKTITVLESTMTKDAEGGVVRGRPTEAGDFKGNVRFTDLGIVMSDLGLTESIDICITCPLETEIKLNSLVRYSDVDYQVTNIVPSDSHLTITGKKWPVAA